MPPRKKISAADSQLSLGIKDSELSAAFVCKGIFSANYLHQHFGKSGDFPKLDDVRPIYEKIKNRWLEEYAGLRTRKEAYTRTEFLDSVLKEIGWTFIPEQELPSGVTRKRPDYCLFLDDEARQRAAKETEAADVFREAATALEAKRVQHSLDEVSDKETPGWFPSQQVQDYLRNAKGKTGQRFFNWAILTNGNEWRLYCEQAANDAYFAFHLAHEEEFCSLEDFCFFIALFRPQSFELNTERRCPLRTANNARFLGFLQGTPQAEKIKASRDEWTKRWLADAEIKSVFLGLLAQNGGDAAKPTKDVAAWEACVEPLKEKFSLVKLGFTKSDLYRVVLPDLIAKPDDFLFAFAERKKELLKIWRTEAALKEFWEGDLGMNFDKKKLDKLRTQKEISDAEFCELCHELQTWVKEKRKQWKLLGLRSAENYDEPADAPRVATIYNGLYGRAQFVPFRKGDPQGNRWIDNEPLFVDWSRASVDWLSTASEARWQGHKMFFTAGVTWSLHANHVAVKSRYQQPCVFDASSSRLTPLASLMDAEVFLAILNSDVFSFSLKKFVKHNQDVEINDVRMMPLAMPTRGQEKRLKELAEQAMEAKRLTFAGATPPNELAASVRALEIELAAKAPAYLKPDAQTKLLRTAADCLAVIELAVNWEAEKLYGVEGLGPFDEF